MGFCCPDLYVLGCTFSDSPNKIMLFSFYWVWISKWSGLISNTYIYCIEEIFSCVFLIIYIILHRGKNQTLKLYYLIVILYSSHISI